MTGKARTTTTFRQAVCNGYDEIVKPPKLCEHTQWVVTQGHVFKGYEALWNREHKLLHSAYGGTFDVYMDGNIGLAMDACEVHEWVKATMEGADLAICRHAARKCVYVELEACVARKKITEKQAQLAHAKLLEAGVPKNFGLWECGIVLRRISIGWVDEFCADWFTTLLDSGVHRDQLWLPATLAHWSKPPKIGKLPIGRFKTIDMDVRSNKVFTFRPHRK